MTELDLRDLFLTTLAKRFGGQRGRWMMVMGQMKLYPRATHPHCNWAVNPSGTVSENEAVEQVADELRALHPIAR